MFNKALTSERDTHIIIINTLSDIKTKILQEDWGAVTSAVNYEGKMLPRTAREIIRLIDETLKNAPVLQEEALAKSLRYITGIPENHTQYQDVKTMALALCSLAVVLTENLIENEIQQYERPASRIEKSWRDSLAVQLKNMQFEKSVGVSDIDILLNSRQQILDLRQKYMEELSKPDEQLQAQKEAKFFKDKINPFFKRLDTQKDTVSTVNQDLQTCMQAMSVGKAQVYINAVQELEVSTENGRYNLTQILRHEPNFSALNPDEAMLDNWYYAIANGAVMNFVKFPVDIYERDANHQIIGIKSPAAAKAALNQYFIHNNLENNFENCHIAHCMAINIYTSPAYIILNTLLRTKTLPADLFVSKPDQDKLVTAALKGMEYRLRGENNGKPLTQNEINLLTQEAVMAVGIAAVGLEQARHLSFDPAKKTQIDAGGNLDARQGRMVRGASGAWVSGVKEDYAMANEAGMPLYYDGFMSSSFGTADAGVFIQDPSQALVSKINTYHIDLHSSTGVMVRDISAFPQEKEYLFPPGSLILSNAESQMKRPENYGDLGTGIGTKNSQVVTTGNSAKSAFYDADIQKRRMEIIQEYAVLKTDNSLSPEDKKASLTTMEQSITALSTQMKKIDLVMYKNFPHPVDVHVICGDSDAAFLIAENGNGVYIDKHSQQISPFVLDQNKKERLMTGLKVVPFQSMETDETKISLNFTQIAWLEKLTETSVDYALSAQDTLQSLEKNTNSTPDPVFECATEKVQIFPNTPLKDRLDAYNNRVDVDALPVNPMTIADKALPSNKIQTADTQDYKTKLQAIKENDPPEKTNESENISRLDRLS